MEEQKALALASEVVGVSREYRRSCRGFLEESLCCEVQRKVQLKAANQRKIKADMQVDASICLTNVKQLLKTEGR
jgi:hypothetical protein